ncbi:MAG: DMT family transporter [Deltaproteobacteria bacterium]|nr:DMT family transporter [Deltaproteobacteria bacterium]
MPPELFALATAFFSALSNVLTKKGLRYSNAGTAVVMSLCINIVFLWGVSFLFIPLDSLRSPGILIFVIVGLFQPGFTRWLTYKGIETLGVSVADPMRATTPLFSALMAILLLGERMTVPVFWATLLIIAGITLLSHHGGSAEKVRLVYVLYPLLASLLAGFSQALRKVGLGAVPHPFLAAAVTATSSLLISLLTVWISAKKKQILLLNLSSLAYYLPAGVAVSLAMVSIYFALDQGKVTVVTPISSTAPLFALTLSALFLRDVERVTIKIVIGACLIVAGVLLISLWR